MENIIKFVYTGFICWDQVDNMLDIIKDADFLGIDDIKEEGIKILVSDLKPQDAINAYNLSDICNSRLLKEKSQKTTIENFEYVQKTDQFLKINIDSIKDILSSDPMIYCKEKIFEGVLRWIVEDANARKSYLMEIFGIIKFGHANSDMVIRILTNGKILTQSKQHK